MKLRGFLAFNALLLGLAVALLCAMVPVYLALDDVPLDVAAPVGILAAFGIPLVLVRLTGALLARLSR